MPYKKYPLLDKRDLKTISISERRSLVTIDGFARPFMPGAGFQSFVNSLPDTLAAADLIALADTLRRARKSEKPIVMAMGAHVVKVGLNPVIIDLMERGWISALAVNGAFMIHDFEIAMAGCTSEDVAENLHKGTYGNTEETGLFLSIAMSEGRRQEFGCGEAVGHYLMQSEFQYVQHSVLYHAYKMNIPVSVHPAIGTDFIHYHPRFEGAVLGELAEKDFMLFTSIISRLSDGGVFMNIGSAVILPEVFLKAVAFCTAQGIELKSFTSAVFDFQHHYRPRRNVVQRPIENGGSGYYFTGHHELMIPLLAAVLLSG